MGVATTVAVEWVRNSTEKILRANVAQKVFDLLSPELLPPDFVDKVMNALPALPPEPATVDVRRSEDEGPGLFHHLRFGVASTRHIMNADLWSEFVSFYSSSAPMSWWLITGRAGTGKSRAAFEFCRALETGRGEIFRAGDFVPVELAPVQGEDFSIWNTGFVDLDATPFPVWNSWRPIRHTLLVFDRLTRHHYARFDELPEGEDDFNNRHNVSEIVNILARNANAGLYGPFRVRVLLLEREYRQADGEGLPFDWYGELPRYLSTCFKPEPTPLPSVPSEGLTLIAHDMQKAVKRDDPELPYVVPRDFLAQLRGIDVRMRPLFAMLLATYTAAHNEPVGARRQVLDYALRRDVMYVLRPAQVQRTPQALKALVVSTLTAGNVGACKIDDAHSLWGSGLGYESDGDEVMFRLYPALPDLLGEYMVLEGVEQADIFGSMRIGDSDLRMLIRKGWEICPVDVADFFERAGQDFGVDARWVEALFLDRKIGELDSDVLCWFMRTAANLMSRFSKKEIDTARKVLAFMNEVAAPEEHHYERARAAASFIRVCCDAGLLEEASAVFVSLRTLKETRENRHCLAEAVSCLVDGLGKSGELVRARVLFEGTLAFDKTVETRGPRARALVGLLTSYGKSGDLAEARQLFAELSASGDAEVVLEQRARAAVNLVVLYARGGHVDEARGLFEEMKLLGDSAAVRAERDKAEKFLEFLTASGWAKHRKRRLAAANAAA